MNDDMVDAFAYAYGRNFSQSRTADEVVGKMAMTQKRLNDRLGKAKFFSNIAINAWSKALWAEVTKPSNVLVFDDVVLVRPSAHAHMRAALEATKSRRLKAWLRMSFNRRERFIQQVKRQGVKQYPNQQHMRDIHAAFAAEQVFQELKDRP